MANKRLNTLCRTELSLQSVCQLLPFNAKLSPDYKLCAMVVDEKKIQFIDVAKKTPLFPAIASHLLGIVQVAWSPDGQKIASCDRAGFILVYEVPIDRTYVLEKILVCVDAISWSPDSQTLLIAYRGMIDIYSFSEKKIIAQIQDSELISCKLSWSPDGEKFVAFCLFTAAGMYSKNGIQLKKLLPIRNTNRSHYVTAVEWSPDGCHIAVALAYSGVYIWEIDMLLSHDFIFEEKSTLLQTGNKWCGPLSWSKCGNTLFWYGDSVPVLHVWNKITLTETCVNTAADLVIEYCSVSPDGKMIALCNAASLTFIYTLTYSQHETRIDLPQEINSISWSPDSDNIAVALSDLSVQILNVSTRTVRRITRGHDNTIIDLEWSPDSQQVVTIAKDNRMILWHTAAFKEVAVNHTFQHPLYYVAWSKKGDSILALSDHFMFLFNALDVNDGKHTVKPLNDAIKNVIWSNDDTFIFLHCENSNVLKYHISSGSFSCVESTDCLPIHAISTCAGCVLLTCFFAGAYLHIKNQTTNYVCTFPLPVEVQKLSGFLYGITADAGDSVFCLSSFVISHTYFFLIDLKKRFLKIVKVEDHLYGSQSVDCKRLVTKTYNRKLLIWTICSWSCAANNIFCATCKKVIFLLLCAQVQLSIEISSLFIPTELWALIMHQIGGKLSHSYESVVQRVYAIDA